MRLIEIMKDIKKLYLAAKQSGKKHDVDAYSECVREYLKSNPFQYVSNLEYIISSSIGLSTLKEFVDRNGISIGSYNEIMTCLNEGVKQCRLRSKNDKLYQEAVAMMESYKHQYQNCFIMFEAFQDKLDDRYTEAYYKNFPVLKGAKSGQVNLSAIISRFGESCIPDMLIYTSKFGDPNVLLEGFVSGDKKRKDDDKAALNNATSEFVKFIKSNKSELISIFYNHKKFPSLEDDIDDSSNRCKISKDSSFVYEVCIGVLKRSDIKSNIVKLNKLSKTIKISFEEDENDDSTPIYQAFVQAGLAGTNDGHEVIPKIKKDYMFGTLILTLSNNKSDKVKTESAVLYQWLSESVKDIPETSITIVESINVKSLGRIVESARNRNTALYRESVLNDDDSIMQQYTESEIHAMEDLISFKEYQITCLENVDQIMNLQQQIYSLYETFEGLIEEDVATSVVPMLPGSQQKVTTNLAEASLGNTRNKKTGDIPDYLKRNHDLSYGEEDPVKKPEEKTNDDHEPSLDDFKRPSAAEDHTKITPYDYSQDDNKSANGKSDDEDDVDDKKQHVNNHYYYTYTNSNNTNSNSFNRHNQDDHSTGKRVNSNDHITNSLEEAFGESALTMAAFAVSTLIVPIILIGGSIYVIYTVNKYNKKCEERINSVISSILGGVEITSPEKYIRAAGKHFENYIEGNEEKISRLLYNPDSASNKPRRIRAHIAVTKKGKKEEDWTADGIVRMINEDTLLFTSNDVITGVVKRENLEEKLSSLNDNSYVKATAVEITDFPTNRSTEGWRYLRDAGLITLTPGSSDLVCTRADGTDNEARSNLILKQMLEDLSKARDKYAVVQISFIMPVKEFLLNDYSRDGGVKTESAFWSIDDLQAQPLTELYHLPADYYNLYHEATSVLITETNALALDLRDAPNEEEEKPGVLARIKAMMMKFINFLIEAYERLFPKGFRAFSKLESKFKKSGALMDACKRNDNILKIMDLKIPHISGVAHAFGDLVKYVNTGKIPTKGMEMYQRPSMTQIAIYWGALSGKDGKGDASLDHMCFRLASDTPISPRSPMLGKNLARISTYLSEDNLLEAFGIKLNNHRGAKMSIDDILTVLKYTKVKINTSVDLWKNRDNRTKMLELLKAITDVTNNVYRTMNQAYKSAVLLLKNAEEGKFESASLLLESAPWELNIFPKMELFQEMGSPAQYFKEVSALESVMHEAVGDADDQKPSSDNHIQDAMTDLDRKLTSTQQAVKKKVQGVVNTSRTIAKPFKRTSMWISKMVANWKDANENDIKEKMADPRQRSNLFNAFKSAIKYGSLMKAGLLLNPIILYLTLSKRWNRSSKEFRIRNEMIGELKAELEILTVKIQDADRAGDNKAKYQLMRFKNELNKKLIRVSGTEVMAKMV